MNSTCITGATARQLPYPELLYRSQYLGPSLYLDEPAVGDERSRDSPETGEG